MTILEWLIQESFVNTIESSYSEIEIRYVNKTIKEIVNICARLLNQWKFNYQVLLLARFDKQDEDRQVLNEIAFFNNMKIIRILTHFDIDNNNIKFQLERQLLNQGTKEWMEYW